jgi:hypothetical protein
VYEIGSLLDSATQISQMVLRKSTNDGATWTQYKPMTGESYAYAVLPHPTNDAIIYLGGYYVQSGICYPVVLKTTDRGATWGKLGSSTFTQQYDQVNVLECGKNNPNKVYAGSYYGVYISTDAGVSWSHPLLNVNVTCMVIDPTNENNVFVGTSSGVQSSTDGGKTWTTMNENLTTQYILSLDYDAVNKVLYAGTMYGGVFRRTIGIASAVEQNLVPDRLELSQNYPNPFNPKTVIRFAIPAQSRYRLTVHNLLGEEIAVLFDATMSAGSHVVQFDAQSLSSGTYFYRLQGGGSILTRKMTILK